MNEYRKLLYIIEKENIFLIETDKIGTMKGLYFDNHIAINTNIETLAEKKCVLAEEIGHHYYSFGDIIDLEDVRNIQQENLGRIWAYETLLPFDKLIEAFNYGVKNRFELSEYLNITESFINEALEYYKKRYGDYHIKIGPYTLQFEPSFGVFTTIV